MDDIFDIFSLNTGTLFSRTPTTSYLSADLVRQGRLSPVPLKDTKYAPLRSFWKLNPPHRAYFRDRYMSACIQDDRVRMPESAIGFGLLAFGAFLAAVLLFKKQSAIETEAELAMPTKPESD
jgi:hypothetical protein